ncbi:MAG: hypothetical protein U0Q22_00805 [Acidimicrobiales bacterium]
MADRLGPGDRVVDGPLRELHDELVDAASRVGDDVPAGRRPGRSRRMLVAAAAGLVAVVGTAVGLALTTDGGTAAADVNVVRDGDEVTVSLAKTVTVSDVEEALSKAGVHVTVVGVPTGPSQVNLFVGVIVFAGSGAQPISGDPRAVARTTFHAGNKVELQLGVPAKPGQSYDAATDATARLEPLAGLHLKGRRLGDVRAELERTAAAHGVTLDYRDQTGQPTTHPDESGTIFGASSISADTVLVMVT